MFHWLTWKSYTAIGIGTGLGFFIIGKLGGTALINVINSFEATAIRAGWSPSVTSLIVDPFGLALSGNPIVCAVIGIIWPLALLWIMFLVVMVALGVLGNGLGKAGTTIDGK